MDKIVPWARRKKLIVIEDCAHTCGGTYKNKKLGTWGDFGCFSFEDKKILSTGDGGCICTNNKKKYDILKSISFHGWSKDPWERHLKRGKNKHWFYEINLGYKYNMNNVIASLAIPQLKKLRNLNKRRRIYIIQKYIKGFRECKNLQPALNYKLKNSCYWLFIFENKKKRKIDKLFKEEWYIFNSSFNAITLPSTL